MIKPLYDRSPVQKEIIKSRQEKIADFFRRYPTPSFLAWESAENALEGAGGAEKGVREEGEMKTEWLVQRLPSLYRFKN